MGLSIRVDILRAVHGWLLEQGVDATLNLSSRAGHYSVGGIPNVSIRSKAVRLGVAGLSMLVHQQRAGEEAGSYRLLGQADLCDPGLCEQLLAIIRAATAQAPPQEDDGSD